MSTAQTVFAAAFQGTRMPRSHEYQAGALASLRHRLEAAKFILPHLEGSVQLDAWLAGWDEGVALGRAELDRTRLAA